MCNRRSVTDNLYRFVMPLFFSDVNISLVPGEETRAWYQMYAHALDIASFIHFVPVISMTNDLLIQKITLGRRHDLSLGGITPAAQTATCTANHHCSSSVGTHARTFDTRPRRHDNMQRKYSRPDARAEVVRQSVRGRYLPPGKA